MAGEKYTDIAANNLVTSLSPDALVCFTNNPNTNPTTVVIELSALTKVSGGLFLANTTPANSASLSITQGSLFYDSNYGYIAIANNVVKRFPLSSF